MIISPIYKDTYYRTTDRTLVYTINVDGQQIFSGKAYKMPNAEYLTININKICQNYLHNEIRNLLEDNSLLSYENADALRTFELCNSEGTVLESYQFLYCWDYEFDWTGETAILSNPINGHYAAGMFKMHTVKTATGVYTDKRTGSYFTDVKCCDYSLIYLNARGGWDEFAIEGTTKKTDDITQYTTDMVFDNNSLDFENNRYISEVITSYEFNTGYLTDLQAKNLAKNLLGSNKVYIHNLNTGKIIPAIITDKTAAYQTYQTNGGKMARYTIKVKESQSKIRK